MTMVRFLSRLFRSLQKLLTLPLRLFSGGRPRPRPTAPEPLEPPEPKMTDAELERHFMALLDQVVAGNSWGQLQGFLIGRGVTVAALTEWLRRRGEVWVAQSEPDRELGRRLGLLGQVATGELGQVATRLGQALQVNEVEAEPSQASGDMDNEAEDYLEQGNLLFEEGRFREALASYDQAIALKPDYYQAWGNRGSALYNLGRYDEAIASHDQSIALMPDYYQAWGNRGSALYNLGRYDEAIASHDQSIALMPDLHQAWANRGSALDKLGRHEEAIASFDQAIALNPDFYQAWSDRGIALRNLGRYEDAIASYDQAIALNPDDYLAWDGQGGALYYLGRYEAAIASCDQAIALNPDFYQAWSDRGIVLAHLGQYEDAIASCDQAIALKPDYYLAWVNRGSSLRHLGQHEEAIASYNQSIALNPDNYDAWYCRGVSLGNLGRHEEEIASYDQAITLKPDNYPAWFSRGFAAHQSKGYNPRAEQEFILNFSFEVASVEMKQSALLASLESVEQKQTNLKVIQESLEQSNALLRKQFADADERLRALLDRPFPPALHQLILHPPLDPLKAFLQQPFPRTSLDQIEQKVSHRPAHLQPDPWNPNSPLNQRGYQGKLNSLRYPLGERSTDKPPSSGPQKTIFKDTHPEGWGQLHWEIAKTHVREARKKSNPVSYWKKAKRHFNRALKTLTESAFPELRLEVLTGLIQVLLNLGDTDEAQELQRQGSDLLRRLLEEENRPDRSKRQLALKFASFDQFTVDLAIQAGDDSQALILAEHSKTVCLRWLLELDNAIPDLTEQQLQALLTPGSAMVYWHISPAAITTFVLLPGSTTPICIAPPKSDEAGPDASGKRSHTLQQLLDWENWLQAWNESYGKAHDSWRNQLPDQLHSLYPILKIPAIHHQLQKHTIHHLILCPHRDLHRLPLHIFFDGSSISPAASSPASELRATSGEVPSGLEPQSDDRSGDFVPSISPEGTFDIARNSIRGRSGDRAYTCTYLPSLSFTTQSHNSKLKTQNPILFSSLLLVENPQHTPESGAKSAFKPDSKAKKLAPLPFAEAEAALIRQIFTEANADPITTVSRGEASQATVADRLRQPHQYFHFTGHGTYNSDTPALSCLFLDQDEQLTLLDILDLDDLSTYDLICLAACETAVTGTESITTEYVGLVSAFLSAGAKAVVSTLWPVESLPSIILVVSFYQNLQSGQPAPAALRAAQTFLRQATPAQLDTWFDHAIRRLESSNANASSIISHLKRQQRIGFADYSHPYYWAAFTISGY